MVIGTAIFEPPPYGPGSTLPTVMVWAKALAKVKMVKSAEKNKRLVNVLFINVTSIISKYLPNHLSEDPETYRNHL
jgi:hypothetical protein